VSRLAQLQAKTMCNDRKGAGKGRCSATVRAMMRYKVMVSPSATIPGSADFRPKVPRYVALPSRQDGISRALRKTFGRGTDLPTDIADLIERLKRIDR